MSTKSNPFRSANTWTAIVTMLAAMFGLATGQTYEIDPTHIGSVIATETGMALLTSLFLLLWTPIMKTYLRIKEAGFDWSALKSRNLAAHALALVAIIAGHYLGAGQVGLLIALLTEAVNFMAHKFEWK
jgi:hypothetical protein